MYVYYNSGFIDAYYNIIILKTGNVSFVLYRNCDVISCQLSPQNNKSMHSSTDFQAPTNGVDFLWSCNMVYHK